MIKITWLNTKSKAMGMIALSQAVGTVHTQRWADGVADAGAVAIRESINSGGANPTAKGGPRIKTSAMIGAVDSRITAAGGIGTATAGYLNGEPEYTKWQEDGTKRGIPAMESMIAADNAMERALYTSGKIALAGIRAQWDTI
jgi:hypothetical protein